MDIDFNHPGTTLRKLKRLRKATKKLQHIPLEKREVNFHIKRKQEHYFKVEQYLRNPHYAKEAAKSKKHARQSA